MIKITFKMGFLGLFVLLISSITTAAAAIDTTKVGVSNGDEFIFIVNKYTSFFEEGYSPGWYEEPSVAVGSEFTMTIVNAIPTQDFFGDWVVEVEFDNGTDSSEYEVTLLEESSDDEEMGFILFTDWTFWEADAKASLEASKAAGEVSSFSVENGEEEFIVKSSISASEDGSSIKGNSVIIYEKSTGVLLYEYTKIDLSSPIISIKSEDEITRKGFSPPSSSSAGFLPGFNLLFTFSTFTLIVFFLKKKKSN